MHRVSPGNNEQTSLAGVEALWRGLVGYNAKSIRVGPHQEGLGNETKIPGYQLVYKHGMMGVHIEKLTRNTKVLSYY